MGQFMTGAIGILTLLAIGVIIADYVKNPSGPNQLAAIGGSTLSNLYGLAAGNSPAALSFSSLSGFQS